MQTGNVTVYLVMMTEWLTECIGVLLWNGGLLTGAVISKQPQAAFPVSTPRVSSRTRLPTALRASTGDYSNPLGQHKTV